MFATVGRRTRRSRLLLTAVSVLIAGTCGAMGGIGARAAMGREAAAAEPAPFADVDPALLRGTTLTVPEANFSVTPAGTGWSWKTRQAAAPVAGQGQDRFFLCVPAAGGTVLMVIVSSPPGVDRLDTRFMEGAKKGAMETSANGMKATAFSYEPTSVPIPGSYRMRMEMAGPDGAVRRCFGTLAWTGKVVTLQACTAAAAEPPELPALVRSFRTLVPPPAARSAVEDLSRPASYVVWELLVVGVVIAINRLSGRSFNVWRIGGYAVVALLVVNIVVAVLTPEFQAMDPSAQGVATGGLIGSTFLALLLAFVGGVARKRNAARRAADEAPAG